MRISSTGFFTSASESREFYSPVKKAGLGRRTFSFAFPLLHQGAPKRVENNFSYSIWDLGFITHRKLSQRDISVHFSVSFVLELILHFLSICGGELALIQQVQQGSSLCQHFYHKDVVWRYPWDLFSKGASEDSALPAASPSLESEVQQREWRQLLSFLCCRCGP